MDNFIGEIRLFAGIFAPVGWNFCDGSILSISDNQALFALLGTTYGGDGQVTFALPDLRGRVPIHQGSLQTQPSVTYTIGQHVDEESVTLTAVNIPAHTHALLIANTDGTVSDPTSDVLAKPKSDCKLFYEAVPSVAFDPRMIGTAGQSMPHENRQPYVAMNYIIATEGIFPSQS